MKHRVCILFALVMIASSAIAQIYVAPTGDDSAAGTINEPLASIEKAILDYFYQLFLRLD